MHAQQLVFALLLLICALSVILTHGLGITVPGTKWCGPGNIATSYDDLGSETELDMCCRAHDNCKDKISSQKQLHGLGNDGMFPIFSCDCEGAFRNCLNTLHNLESTALGRVYYSTARVCFGFGHPIVSCHEQQLDMFLKRCVSYNVDEKEPKRWQFYDLAFYTYTNESVENEEVEEEGDN